MTDMKAPTNTTAKIENDPMTALGLAYAGEAGIYRMESEGQKEFVSSDTLPTEISESSRRALEAAGVVFLGEVPGDPIFQYVKLPEGWRKKRTDHAMWSHLVDEKGRKRADIFYKAAFYDRNAHASACTRFNRGYGKAEGGACSTDVLDGDAVIHTTRVERLDGDTPDGMYKTRKTSEAAAGAWLDGHYPDWRDPAAYWD
jgi:hypothetical protein